VVACAKTAEQQASAADSSAPAPSLTADLVGDLSQAEQKVVGLAKAIPESKYAWRPAAGVRSVGDVLRHVASDNYLLPAVLGATPDSSTGIKADDYKTATAFEQRKATKDSTVAELERSFAFLKQSIQNAPADQMGDTVTLFGQSFTRQQALILTATHLHEHLGQLIAYARSNGVTPPWSQ
jgi:uncharacterized damage-inducible protein DinB